LNAGVIAFLVPGSNSHQNSDIDRQRPSEDEDLAGLKELRQTDLAVSNTFAHGHDIPSSLNTLTRDRKLPLPGLIATLIDMRKLPVGPS